jgi:hypothetical protein
VADGRENSNWSDSPVDFSLATTEEIRSWAEWAKGVMSEASKAGTDAQALNAQRERGEVLVDFGGHFRRMGKTGQCDYWVVCPDGTLRDPDKVMYRKRYTAEGNKQWKIVSPEELALAYSKSNSADNHHCKVVKLPVEGATEAQRERAAKIETELSAMPGAFGLDPKLAEKAQKRLEAIRAAYDRLDLHHTRGWQEEWSFQDIAGQSGVHLGEGGDFAHLINYADPFEEWCEKREAQAIRAVPCGDGMLELLAYEKYGHWQLNMRWCEMREGESIPEEPQPEPPEGDPVDISKVDLSQLFGGAAKARK